MDQIDRSIIYHLQKEGRLSNVELAKRVGLSPTPTLRRVRTLEKEGTIAGYRALINPEAVGRSFRVMLWLSLSEVNRDTMSTLEQALAEIPDDVEAYRMFGAPDYFLRVAVADSDAYEALYTTTLASLPYVQRIESMIAMKEIKSGVELPVE
ncbi:MAG: Lrp/AsnC family transcriptional regulator [Actinobacteria bacterium]|nr:MAG: Lrp/AsnC family transcriptional regulator [Actinomycetota bacterium]